MHPIVERMHDLRKSLGKTQMEVAYEISTPGCPVPPDHISRWEHGTKPRRIYLERLQKWVEEHSEGGPR